MEDDKTNYFTKGFKNKSKAIIFIPTRSCKIINILCQLFDIIGFICTGKNVQTFISISY